jgi:hypothetical protein
MPDSPPPALAEQARNVRWWLKALRRSRLLSVLLVVQFLIVPMIWAIWEPSQWVRLVVSFALISPIYAKIKDIRHREARALESADEAAERTGRRRPLGAPAPEHHPATFTWRSPTGRRLTAQAALFSSLTAVGVAMIWLVAADDPPDSTGDFAQVALIVLLLVILPAALGALNVGGVLRHIRRVLAEPAERAIVEVIGIDPRNQVWVMQPLDTEPLSPITVKLVGGKGFLVAGDTLLTQGTITKPAKNWRRLVPPLMAITGEFGTLWAHHVNAPDTPLSDTMITVSIATSGTGSADLPGPYSGGR